MIGERIVTGETREEFASRAEPLPPSIPAGSHSTTMTRTLTTSPNRLEADPDTETLLQVFFRVVVGLMTSPR